MASSSAAAVALILVIAVVTANARQLSAATSRHVCESFDSNQLCPANNGTTTTSINNGTTTSAATGGSSSEEMVCTSESQYCFAMFCDDVDDDPASSSSLQPPRRRTRFIKQGCWQASLPRGPPYDKSSSRCGDTCTAYVKRRRRSRTSSSSSAKTASASSAYHFCCCSGPNCNAQVTVEYVDHDDDDDQDEVLFGGDAKRNRLANNNGGDQDSSTSEKTVVMVVVLLVCGGALLLVIVAALLFCSPQSSLIRRTLLNRKQTNQQQQQQKSSGSAESSFLLPHKDEQASFAAAADPLRLDPTHFTVHHQIASGRWGTIYRGDWTTSSSSPSSVVALKMYTSSSHRSFYENEKLIYSLVKHPNVLPYHGYYEVTNNSDTTNSDVTDQQQQPQQQQLVCPRPPLHHHQMVLVFELASCNLREYLESTSSISPHAALHISQGIARGLSHLHNLEAATNHAIVAHRDVTPRNVLVQFKSNNSTNSDSSASHDLPHVLLADFGLSLLTKGSKYYEGTTSTSTTTTTSPPSQLQQHQLRSRQAEFCSLTEAGTLRYMAPELLEGAVNLKDCENALKQADVYSLALLLWEVNNACALFRVTGPHQQLQQQQQVGEIFGNPLHQPPFAEETNDDDDDTAGHHQQQQQQEGDDVIINYSSSGKADVSLERMVRLVVSDRRRPGFHRWVDTPVTRSLRDTLCESWDSEPDARLTSVCVQERLTELLNNINKINSSRNNNHQHHQVQLQPLETKYVPPRAPIDEPWTGRNVCLERNLLVVNNHNNSDDRGGHHHHHVIGNGGGGAGGEHSVSSSSVSAAASTLTHTTELSSSSESSTNTATPAAPPVGGAAAAAGEPTTSNNNLIDSHKKNITLILNKF